MDGMEVLGLLGRAADRLPSTRVRLSGMRRTALDTDPTCA